MNFDNSWMVNYGVKLRKKEENFDNNRTSNLPSLPRNFTSMVHKISNIVETKVKPSSMHRETVASTKWENIRPPRSSGGSGNSRSNPLSTHPRTKSICMKKDIPSSGQEFGLQFLDDRRAEDTAMILSSSSTYDFDTMLNPRGRVCTHSFDKKNLGRCHTNWRESYFQYWEEDWERIHVWGLIALPPPQKIQTRFEMFKNADKDLSDIHSIRRHSAEIIIASRLTNYVMFDHKGSDAHGRVCPHKETWHTKRMYTHYVEGGYTYFAVECGSSTRSMFHCKSWIGDRRKRT